jgi:hypothetical protein
MLPTRVRAAGVAAMVALTGGVADAAGADSGKCLTPPPQGFVQVVEDFIRVGAPTRTVWRVFPDGRIEAATWNGEGVLTGVGGAEASADRAALHESLAPLAAVPQVGGADDPIGQSAYYLIVAAWSAEGGSRAHVTTEPSAATARMVDALRKAAAPDQPAPAGAHVWTLPTPLPGAAHERRLTDCSDPLTAAVGAAVSGGALLSGAAAGVDIAPVRAAIAALGAREIGVHLPFGTFAVGTVDVR